MQGETGGQGHHHGGGEKHERGLVLEHIPPDDFFGDKVNKDTQDVDHDGHAPKGGTRKPAGKGNILVAGFLAGLSSDWASSLSLWI